MEINKKSKAFLHRLCSIFSPSEQETSQTLYEDFSSSGDGIRSTKSLEELKISQDEEILRLQKQISFSQILKEDLEMKRQDLDTQLQNTRSHNYEMDHHFQESINEVKHGIAAYGQIQELKKQISNLKDEEDNYIKQVTKKESANAIVLKKLNHSKQKLQDNLVDYEELRNLYYIEMQHLAQLNKCCRYYLERNKSMKKLFDETKGNESSLISNVEISRTHSNEILGQISELKNTLQEKINGLNKDFLNKNNPNIERDLKQMELEERLKEEECCQLEERLKMKQKECERVRSILNRNKID